MACMFPLREWRCVRRADRGLPLNGGYDGQEWVAAYPPRRVPARDVGGMGRIASAVRPRYRRVAHAYFTCDQGRASGDGGTGVALRARAGAVATVLAQPSSGLRLENRRAVDQQAVERGGRVGARLSVASSSPLSSPGPTRRFRGRAENRRAAE